ncbi:MAG: DUF4405 domain-containing protein [Deltaproteobacteria bacterium]|jgi:hypothetical protein|nr:DUF4405 domain-containing protein [Deltaproteobacteria bacterium]
MPLGLNVRLAIDLCMTALLPFAMAYRVTGDAPHEWIGVSVFVLLVVHNAFNRRWYRTPFKATRNFRRMMNVAINLLLLTAMATLLITGVLLSRTVFAFMGFNGGMAIRQTHTLAAYWGLILISLHLGMRWEMIMAATQKITPCARKRPIWTIIIRIVAALIVIYGVYASFDRNMGAKLFLGYSFDFWPPDRPVVLLFTGNLAIMGVYVCAIHYALKLLAYRRATNQAGGRL